MKYLIVFLSMLLFFTCQNQAPVSFYSIQVEVSGAENGQAQLKRLDVETNQAVIVENLNFSDGNFEFKGSLTYPFPHTIVINDTFPVHFFLENSNMTIEADLSGKKPVSVSGSESDALFRPYWGKLTRLWDTGDSLYDLRLGSEIAEVERIEKRLELIRQEEKAYSQHFIKTHPESFVAPFAAFYYVQAFDVPAEEVDSILWSFDSKLSQSIYVKELEKIQDLKLRLKPDKPAPDFKLLDTMGIEITLNDLKGKTVLIDFWASWCKPCREENPKLVALFEKYKNKNFTILGISLDTKRATWTKAIRDDKLNWLHVSDLKGWKSEVAAEYGVKAIPQNFLIDENGMIKGHNLSPVEIGEYLEGI